MREPPGGANEKETRQRHTRLLAQATVQNPAHSGVHRLRAKSRAATESYEALVDVLEVGPPRSVALSISLGAESARVIPPASADLQAAAA